MIQLLRSIVLIFVSLHKQCVCVRVFVPVYVCIIKKNFGNEVTRVVVALMRYDCGDGNDDDNDDDSNDDSNNDSNSGGDDDDDYYFDDNSLTPSVLAIF